jgi:hypothetical protein
MSISGGEYNVFESVKYVKTLNSMNNYKCKNVQKENSNCGLKKDWEKLFTTEKSNFINIASNPKGRT